MRKIIKLNLQHINEIANLRLLQEKETGNEMSPEYIESYKKWLEAHMNIDFMMYGAFEDDQLVAVFGNNILSKRGQNYSYVCGLFTLPEYRSKGYQSSLLPLLEKDKKILSITETELVMDSPTKEVATKFYTEGLGLEFITNKYSILLKEEPKLMPQTTDLEIKPITSQNFNYYLPYYLNHDISNIYDKELYIKQLSTKINNKNNISFALYNGENLISIISIDIQTFIPHPANISGITAVIEIIDNNEINNKFLQAQTQILNNIIYSLYQQGIIYYKAYANETNSQIFTQIGFKQEKTAMRTKHTQPNIEIKR